MSKPMFDSDDATMDHQYIEDHHVVDRYVRNQLQDSEASAFERTFLDDTELQNQVELAEAMQSQLKLAASSLEPVPAALEKTRWFQRPQLLAASIVFVLGVPLIITSLALRDTRALLGAPASVAATLSLGAVRGSDGEQFVVPANSPIVLRFDIGADTDDEFTVIVKADLGETLILEHAIVDSQGAVSIFIHGLPVGVHELRIEAVNATQNGTTYTYELGAVP